MKSTIAIRADASHEIGFGHIKRCIVLAKGIRKKSNVIFITQNPEAVSLIEENKFKTIKLNQSIGKDEEIGAIQKIIAQNNIKKILIDLKEEVSQDYIEELKKTGVVTILLDNIGDGRKNANIVIYPVAHLDKKIFNGIKGKLYHGWDYVIIDKKFFAKRKIGVGKQRILVTIGGSDTNNLTPKVMGVLEKLRQDFECIIVIGPGFTNQALQAPDKRFIIKKNAPDMAKLMLSSDIGIILFGVSAYEAAAARLPCIIISDSERNEQATRIFHKFKTSVYIGDFKGATEKEKGNNEEKSLEDLEKSLNLAVSKLLTNEVVRQRMVVNCRKFLKPKRLIFDII